MRAKVFDGKEMAKGTCRLHLYVDRLIVRSKLDYTYRLLLVTYKVNLHEAV
jgi:hypothetical protein